MNEPSKQLLRVLAILTSTAALLACANRWDRGGVHLPQGDAAKGREAFVELRCHACHEIEGFDPPTPIRAETRVLLGGQIGGIKTYGDLVTSIANPSHRIARGYPPEAVAVDGVPLMTLIHLNEVMTVQQLVDVAAFLITAYEGMPPAIRLDNVNDSDDAALSQKPTL